MFMAFVSSPNVRPMFKDWLPIGDWKNSSGFKVEESWRLEYQAFRAFNMTGMTLARDLVGTHVLLEDLDRYRNPTNDMDTDRCIDSYVAAMMSDLSIVAECRRQLALFHPWARHYHQITPPKGISADLTIRTPEAMRNAAMHTFRDQQLEVCSSSSFSNLFPGALPDDVAEDILPASEKLYYPVHKPRDRSVVKAMQQAEYNLDDF
ncbi:hypothetical protein PG996_003670 [Apiospora saccharicola]|uniref:Uncharacterized protein n=1 Tax=Apiospora saccharicola TaxID=335842 RepID=A0ABR1W1Z0_9PEZI